MGIQQQQETVTPPITSIDRSFRQKINKATEILNDTIEQLDLIFFNTLHPKNLEYAFFSKSVGNFSRIDHTPGQKMSFNKIKSIAVISQVLSDHSGMKLEYNHRKRNEKEQTTRRLKKMLLKNRWVNEAIKRGIKKYLEMNVKENTMIQNLWNAAKTALRWKFIAIENFLKKKKKKISNKQTYHLKIRKRRENKT